MTQQEMIKKLQEISFTLVELNLYLDTHPDCQQALTLYNTYAQQQKELREEYYKNYGTLLNFGNMPAGDSFQWVNSPWPWEN